MALFWERILRKPGKVPSHARPCQPASMPRRNNQGRSISTASVSTEQGKIFEAFHIESNSRREGKSVIRQRAQFGSLPPEEPCAGLREVKGGGEKVYSRKERSRDLRRGDGSKRSQLDYSHPSGFIGPQASSAPHDGTGAKVGVVPCSPSARSS